MVDRRSQNPRVLAKARAALFVLKTLGPVSFTYEPIAISADADAFLDDVLAAG